MYLFSKRCYEFAFNTFFKLEISHTFRNSHLNAFITQITLCLISPFVI